MSLVSLLVVLLVLGLVWYAITIIPLPPPFRVVAQVVLIIIAIVWLLGMVGLVDVGPLRIR